MPLSTRPSPPPANSACIRVAESASEMTTRAAAVRPALHAQSHKMEARPATGRRAEVCAHLGRPCATAPASRKEPLVQTAQPERMVVGASAWPAPMSPVVVHPAPYVRSRLGHRKPPATAAIAGSCVTPATMLAAVPARATTVQRLVALPAQPAPRIRTAQRPARPALAPSIATLATTTAAFWASA